LQTALALHAQLPLLDLPFDDSIHSNNSVL